MFIPVSDNTIQLT